MKIQIKSLTRSDRFKCKFGIFNLLLRYGEYSVLLRRGSLNAIPHLKFYPRLNTTCERLAEISDFCEFAETNILLGGEHPKKIVHSTFGSSYEILVSQSGVDFMPTTKGPIRVGPCCVFGTRTTILSGTTIGHNSIVGAGAVALGTYPSYSAIMGVPGRRRFARLKKYQIEFLEKYPWWQASYDWIMKSIKDIQEEKPPNLPFEHDPNTDRYLVIRLSLEDARIVGTALEGLWNSKTFIPQAKFPAQFTQYLESFDGLGPIEIDTNILSKCF